MAVIYPTKDGKVVLEGARNHLEVYWKKTMIWELSQAMTLIVSSQ